MGTDKNAMLDSTELRADGLASSSSGSPSALRSPGQSVVVSPDDPHSDPQQAAHTILPQQTGVEDAGHNSTSGDEPPSNAAPYTAAFSISDGEVISHDPRLNRDGDALYRFLLWQSAEQPDYVVRMKGTHTERKTRTVFRKDLEGNTQPHEEEYTEKITDFDFRIDLGEQIVHGPVHWTVAAAEPAYRGEMFLEVISGDHGPSLRGGRRKATKAEIEAAEKSTRFREEHGIPPWVTPGSDEWQDTVGVSPPPGAQIVGSSMTIKDWADEYCASPKLLKEFTYRKVVYGWNTANLHDAIVAAIRAIYSHKVSVAFAMPSHRTIRVRPATRLARVLAGQWINLLPIVRLLCSPFLWLCARFGGQAGDGQRDVCTVSGGRWEVCGAAYALKTWREPLDGVRPLPPEARLDGRWKEAPDGPGPLHLVGEREGEWFQRWEGPIQNAVLRGVRTDVPLGWGNRAARALDGYRPPSYYAAWPQMYR